MRDDARIQNSCKRLSLDVIYCVKFCMMLEDSIFCDFFFLNVVLKINSTLEVMSVADTAGFEHLNISQL
jgi:hypothetical protein